jgi:surface antigen/LysM repeat protein
MSVTQGSTTAVDQPAPVKRHHKSMSKIKPSIVAVYVSVFVFIIAIISIGYNEPQNSSMVVSATKVSPLSEPDQTSVDDVVATSVAASIAQTANLPIANNVSNLAISAKIESEFVQTDGINTTKPQIIEADTVNRSVINYTVTATDTIDTLASNFGISKQTIKWANNLTNDTLITGTELRILPVDGVTYTVESGDTIDSIASKYGVDKTRLVLYNDLEVSGLELGAKIILPSATLPDNERPGYVAPVAITRYYAGTGTGFGGNTWNIGYGTGSCPSYGYGQCTCYSYARRVQLGLPVGTLWGNAGSWAQSARNAGLAVDGTPSVGAIIQDWGHVAIVESISPNGDLSISEMNAYVSGGGWNIVSGRIVHAGNVGQYLYIH